MPLVVWLTALTLAVEPPVQNQPREFTGAVGAFRVELEASAQAVEVEQPFTLTVRVMSRGRMPVVRAPGRPNLQLIAGYAESFHIEEAESPERRVGENSWEFDYRLKPRSTDVTEVPELPFYYFDPAVDPNRYQKTFADALPLTVTAANTEGPAVIVPPLPVGPETLYSVAPADRVLRSGAESILPPWWVAALGLALPPLGCGLAWVAWRRLYPDAARRARIRRSQAAERALQRLKQLDGRATEEHAQQLEQTLTGFLHRRFDLQIESPTPTEALLHLGTFGISLELMAQVRAVYQSCAAARFGGASPSGLGERVREVIVTLENEACRAPHTS